MRHCGTAAKERVYACEKCHIILLHNQLKQPVKGCLHGTKGEKKKVLNAQRSQKYTHNIMYIIHTEKTSRPFLLKLESGILCDKTYIALGRLGASSSDHVNYDHRGPAEFSSMSGSILGTASQVSWPL